ncbi:MAG: type II toxin-antitoxin system RelE/ParE family toxin [Candidatus Gastranaerophilales bacterium]|nr:type II toxin-antitoxin system RelE/ParE family toxin [Candidatus Gastranaerophilales bacterium]
MIKSFRHKGLKKFFQNGDASGIMPEHCAKISRLLFAIDSAPNVKALNLPGFGLHPLKGDLKDHWSVSVNGNWRITFKFEDKDAYVLDYQDYH